MRLLYVLSQFSRGGAENHVADLVADQVRRGNEVMVLGLGEGPNRPAEYEAFLQEQGATTSSPRSLCQRARYSPGLLLWLDCQIRGFGPDLIHTHLPRADIAVAVWQMLKAAQIPIVSTVHGWEPRYSHPVNRRLLRWTYNRASALVGVSDWLKNATTQLGVHDRLFTVIHHGVKGRTVQPGEAEKIRSELLAGFGVGELVIVGTVARLAVQKGIDVLLRAVSELPDHVVVVILGSDEGEAENLSELVGELGIADRCRFVGYQENVSEWISAFDVFALPSRWEGFGLVLLEAGLCGVPIVATDIAPINAIIRNDRDGLLVPVNDYHALANAIQKIGSETGLSDRLRKNFSDRIAADFSKSTMTNSVNRIYFELLSSSES